MTSRTYRDCLGALLAGAVLMLVAATAYGRTSVVEWPVIRVGELPTEAREVLGRIHTGGPFRHERDGVVFGNRERSLPPMRRGYYHEYTVYTPGERTRGSRRIVCGGKPTTPEVCFYTDDHYRTFSRIRE